MLYQAIRRGSEEFHNGDFGNDDYDRALEQRCNWDRQVCPTELEIECLVDFVNKWSSRMKRDIPAIRSALTEILPDLDHLRHKTILDVDLCDQGTSELICRSFKRLANFGSRKAPTGTSKMLHIIYPKLFLMWDGAIRCGYGGYDWIWYTDFLRRMQMIAKRAIKQVKENDSYHSDEMAIASLTGCKHTLAKTLDEYNFMKFTKNCDAVWKAEYESCSSPPDVR